MRWNMILEMARRELCKPDASTVSICSLYTIEKRFSGNRESCHFCFRSREFAAKREFRSLFRAVRIGFGGGGRQNRGFLLRFCLLRAPRGAFLEVAVDKIRAFCSVFVYFDGRAPFLKAAVDKIKAFCSVFVYFEGRAELFWRWR